MHSDEPAPGREVREDQDPIVVDDELREQWDELEDVLVIHQLEYEWGSGIGAAPYGYFTRLREQTERNDDEPCEECGSTEEVVFFTQDRAGIAGARKTTCSRCGHKKSQEQFH